MSEIIEMGKGMGLLTAEEIIAADDIEYRDVPVPEWTPGYVKGGDVEPRCVRLRTMTAAEAIEFATEFSSLDQAGRNAVIIVMIAKCAVDAEGNPLFSEEQVGSLRSKSFPVYNRLQKEVLDLNGFGDEETATEAEKKDSEKAAG